MAFAADLYEKFSSLINIVIIYISEAHANDEWPISFSNQTNQHKNLNERVQAAKQIDIHGLPLFVDSFDKDNFQERYSAWPERAFIIENNILKYISFHEVDGYDDWHSTVLDYVEKLA